MHRLKNDVAKLRRSTLTKILECGNYVPPKLLALVFALDEENQKLTASAEQRQMEEETKIFRNIRNPSEKP